MKNTLDAMNEVKAEVDRVAYRLQRLAAAFDATGNKEVAEKLFFDAEALEEVVKLLVPAWNKDMDEQMSHGQKMIGGILNLALNCEIKPLNKEEEPQHV